MWRHLLRRNRKRNIYDPVWQQQYLAQFREKHKVDNPPLPPLLVELMEAGRWRQPTDEHIRAVLPSLPDPIYFLESYESMKFESWGLFADAPASAAFWHEYRGSRDGQRDLPWLDIEKALFIAVNRHLGDDVAIALDYRTSRNDPRVVATHWSTAPARCEWREVAAQFSEFVERMGF